MSKLCYTQTMEYYSVKKKGWNINMFNNMDESQKYYNKWKK